MPQVIIAKDITLDLPIHTARRNKGGRKHVIVKEVGGRLTQQDPKHTWIRALHNVSFEINRGERVALIGHNGAGKSSLLRVLAGIYPPTRGKVFVQGKISTLFTNSIGVNPSATGYENITLMGVLLGLSKKEIEAIRPAVAEFSELGEFLDMPVRTYSAGMRTRLGFAIATSIKPECLLIDEVMGAGDARFQKKAQQRMNDVMSTAYTLVLASHSIGTIKEFCDRAIWLQHGKLRQFGPIDEVVEMFEEENPPLPSKDK